MDRTESLGRRSDSEEAIEVSGLERETGRSERRGRAKGGGEAHADGGARQNIRRGTHRGTRHEAPATRWRAPLDGVKRTRARGRGRNCPHMHARRQASAHGELLGLCAGYSHNPTLAHRGAMTSACATTPTCAMTRTITVLPLSALHAT